MRTLSLTLLALLACAGCERTIHEASGERRPLDAPTAAERSPRVVPAVDGVPIA